MSEVMSRLFFSCLILLLACEFADAGHYCIANPKASEELIQTKLDFCCGDIPESCALIQPGQPCYVPNDLRTTASYVFSNWYAGGAECDFDGAEIKTTTDLSHGDCKFDRAPWQH